MDKKCVITGLARGSLHQGWVSHCEQRKTHQSEYKVPITEGNDLSMLIVGSSASQRQLDVINVKGKQDAKRCINTRQR